VQFPLLARSSVLAVSDLRVAGRVRLSQARRGGIAVSFTAPAGAARVRLLKAGTTRAIATKLVALATSGRQVVHLRSAHARAGRYVVDVAIGTSASTLTRPLTAQLTLSR
jgi:hypothetical protein